MKIIRNIPFCCKCVAALKYLNKHKKAIALAKASGDKETEKEEIRLAMSSWGQNFMRIIGSPVHVEGRENLPTEGPVVYMCNHQGFADITTLCGVLDTIQFAYVAKEELSKLPSYGPWMHRVRSVTIKRGDPRESLKAINRGIDLIEEGFSLLIFPEGTRSRGPFVGEFKKGSMKLATKPQVPIIPISIEGSYHLLEENGYLCKGDVFVKIHPAIPTAGLSREEQKNLHEKVYATIVDGQKGLVDKATSMQQQ